MQCFIIQFPDEEKIINSTNENNKGNLFYKSLINILEFLQIKTNSFIDKLFSKNLSIDTYSLGIYSKLRRSGKIVLWY